MRPSKNRDFDPWSLKVGGGSNTFCAPLYFFGLRRYVRREQSRFSRFTGTRCSPPPDPDRCQHSRTAHETLPLPVLGQSSTTAAYDLVIGTGSGVNVTQHHTLQHNIPNFRAYDDAGNAKRDRTGPGHVNRLLREAWLAWPAWRIF
jgi:hypothetical protein